MDIYDIIMKGGEGGNQNLTSHMTLSNTSQS